MTRKTRRGMISIEFMSALVLVLATMVLFLGVTSKRARVAIRLEADRAATRLAERTLLTLRSNGYEPASSADGVAIRRLPDAAPPAHSWVEVTAIVGERKSALVGLVPLKEAP